MKTGTRVVMAAVAGLAAFASSAQAQGSGRDIQVQVSQEPRLELDEYPNPLPASDEVWIENLTELEVRDALRAGKTNALILTGSVELNGPWVTTGKHNNVLRVTGESIARRMGDMLIAPPVLIEPGDPLRSTTPGSFSLSPATYQGLIKDIANSLRVQGFKNVFIVGDSGGNVRGSTEAAAALMTEWKGTGARAFYIPEFYNYDEIMVYQREKLGVNETRYQDRFHDNYYISTMIMVGNPEDVNYSERVRIGKATINGFSLEPIEKTLWHGRQLIEFRTDETVAGIRKAMAQTSTDQR